MIRLLPCRAITIDGYGGRLTWCAMRRNRREVEQKRPGFLREGDWRHTAAREHIHSGSLIIPWRGADFSQRLSMNTKQVTIAALNDVDAKSQTVDILEELRLPDTSERRDNKHLANLLLFPNELNISALLAHANPYTKEYTAGEYPLTNKSTSSCFALDEIIKHMTFSEAIEWSPDLDRYPTAPNLLVLGGPINNPITRLILGTGQRSLFFEHLGNARYAAGPPIRIMIEDQVGQGAPPPERWVLVGEDGVTLGTPDDFLLLTSVKDPFNSARIFNVSGGWGPGVRTIKSLLSNNRFIDRLYTDTKNLPGWQCLLPLTRTTHGYLDIEQGFSDRKIYEISDEFVFSGEEYYDFHTLSEFIQHFANELGGVLGTGKGTDAFRVLRHDKLELAEIRRDLLLWARERGVTLSQLKAALSDSDQPAETTAPAAEPESRSIPRAAVARNAEQLFGISAATPARRYHKSDGPEFSLEELADRVLLAAAEATRNEMKNRAKRGELSPEDRARWQKAGRFVYHARK